MEGGSNNDSWWNSLSWTEKTVAVLLGAGGLVALGWVGERFGFGQQSEQPKQASPFSFGAPPQQQQKQQKGRAPLNAAPSKKAQEIEFEIRGLLMKADEAKSKGLYEEAEGYYQKAISYLESNPELGPEHHYVALCCYALGLMLRQKEDYPRAETYITRAIKILEQSPSTPEMVEQLADALATLADLYITMKKYDAADIPLQQAIHLIQTKATIISAYEPKNRQEEQGKEEELGRISQELGILFDTYSKLRYEQKQYAQAEEFGKRAMMVLMSQVNQEKALEPFITRSMLRLGDIMLCLGKVTDANDLYTKIIEEQEGEGNQKLVASFCRLFGSTNVNHGFYEAAEGYYQKSRAIFQKFKSDEKMYADYPDALNDLLVVLKEIGKHQEAQEIEKEIIDILMERKAIAPLTVSRYLRTEDASVQFFTEEGTDVFAPYFNMSIAIKKDKLTAGTHVVAAFPNPGNEEQPSIHVEQTVDTNDQTKLIFTSPHLKKVDNTVYVVPISIYSDSSKSKLMGSHPVMIYSPLDSTTIATAEELHARLAASRPKPATLG